jgi:two-component system, OmpR family, response regulator
MLADTGHIIIVDDDPALRRLVTSYLEDHNIPTRSASNRVELSRHFEGTHPSLIILDLRLGQEDGLDLLREIRSHSDVPVIITTGHRTDEIDRIVGLELGADDYIIKPFRSQRAACTCPRRIAATGDGPGRTSPQSGARRIQIQRLAARAAGPKTYRS